MLFYVSEKKVNLSEWDSAQSEWCIRIFDAVREDLPGLDIEPHDIKEISRSYEDGSAIVQFTFRAFNDSHHVDNLVTEVLDEPSDDSYTDYSFGVDFQEDDCPED